MTDLLLFATAPELPDEVAEWLDENPPRWVDHTEGPHFEECLVARGRQGEAVALVECTCALVARYRGGRSA